MSEAERICDTVVISGSGGEGDIPTTPGGLEGVSRVPPRRKSLHTLTMRGGYGYRPPGSIQGSCRKGVVLSLTGRKALIPFDTAPGSY